MSQAQRNNDSNIADKARKYSNLKYGTEIFELVFNIAINLILLFSGLSLILSNAVSRLLNSSNPYLLLPVFLIFLSFIYYVLNFTLEFYQSFLIEHQFGLSKQSINEWFKDQLKSGVLGFVMSLICLEALYLVIHLSPNYWWLILTIVFILFNVVLTNLAPIIIVPLFFKYKPLNDEALKSRIKSLADKMQIKIMDMFEIDFSKKTVKANAGLMGLGKTRRVILADTLKDKYTHEEIEVIMAHEFAHHKLKHMAKLIFIGCIVTMVSFYLIHVTSNYFLSKLHFNSLTHLAVLPLFFLYMTFISLILRPLMNTISCKFETDADLMALKATNMKEPFISMMNKLAEQNLSDKNPHPIIKLFFFDHPPVGERIALAENFQVKTS